MNKELCWLLLLLGAMLAKILPTGHVGIAWAVDKYTHRGASFNDIAFWILLITLAIWLAGDILSRLPTRGGA
jgi:hypothetical protein